MFVLYDWPLLHVSTQLRIYMYITLIHGSVFRDYMSCFVEIRQISVGNRRTVRDHSINNEYLHTSSADNRLNKLTFSHCKACNSPAMMQTQLAHNTVNKVEVCLFSFLFLTTVCLQWRIQRRRVRAMQLPTGIGLQQFFAHGKYHHWLTCKLGTFLKMLYCTLLMFGKLQQSEATFRL